MCLNYNRYCRRMQAAADGNQRPPQRLSGMPDVADLGRSYRGVAGHWDRAEALPLRLARLHELLDQLVGECLLQDDTLLASQGFGQRLSRVILNEDNEG